MAWCWRLWRAATNNGRGGREKREQEGDMMGKDVGRWVLEGLAHPIISPPTHTCQAKIFANSPFQLFHVKHFQFSFLKPELAVMLGSLGPQFSFLKLGTPAANFHLQKPFAASFSYERIFHFYWRKILRRIWIEPIENGYNKKKN